MRVFVVFLLVGLAYCSGQNISENQVIQSNFHHEESCSAAKGNCVLKNECHHPVDTKYEVLCPMQQDLGAVCCKDFPIEHLNCRQLHNECMSDCPMNLGRRGCPNNQLCCILI